MAKVYKPNNTMRYFLFFIVTLFITYALLYCSKAKIVYKEQPGGEMGYDRMSLGITSLIIAAILTALYYMFV